MMQTLDELMESASLALAEMDYARCEQLSLDALSQSRDAGDWVMYQRVLLPLQEARRQKRQLALDGPIRLGVKARPGDTARLVPEGGNGCLVLNDCCDAMDDANVVSQAGPCFERLYADNPIDTDQWIITSPQNAIYTVTLPAPDQALQDQWFRTGSPQHQHAAHWFMRASEALGDAALASVTSELGSPQRVLDLEHALYAVDDHEILHQRLAEAAHALHEAQR